VQPERQCATLSHSSPEFRTPFPQRRDGEGLMMGKVEVEVGVRLGVEEVGVEVEVTGRGGDVIEVGSGEETVDEGAVVGVGTRGAIEQEGMLPETRL